MTLVAFWPASTFALALAIGLSMLPSYGCGPSDEDLLRKRVHALELKLSDEQQRRDDLQVRAQAIRARNKVLIRLVQGLTSKTERMEPTSPDSAVGPAQEALAALDDDLAVLARSVRKSREELMELHSERERLKGNLKDAMATIEEAREREALAKERVQTFRSVLLRLKSMIEAAQLDVRVVRGRMVLQLPEAVLFESGRAKIKKQGRQVLEDVAEALQEVPERSFQVAGHTDSVPIRNWRHPSNWHLSASRAIAVTRYLVERGVPRSRISAAGYADTQPAEKPAGDDGEAANRRIEIVLLPKLDELPDLSFLEADPEKQGAETDGQEQDEGAEPADEEGGQAAPGEEPPALRDGEATRTEPASAEPAEKQDAEEEPAPPEAPAAGNGSSSGNGNGRGR